MVIIYRLGGTITKIVELVFKRHMLQFLGTKPSRFRQVENKRLYVSEYFETKKL